MSSIGTYYGNTIRWPLTPEAPTLSYFINSSDPIVQQAVRDSYDAWNAVDTSYVSVLETEISSTADIVVVVDNDLGNPYAGGYASYGYNGDGEISSCTVHLLASQAALGYELLRPLAQHETGHCLGLLHSVSKGAVMSYRGGGQTPTDDDAFALTLLYPSTGTALPPSCNTVQSASSSQGPHQQDALLSFLFTFGFMVLGWRALRRSRPIFGR